jgi:micrococcal nuclease
VALSGTVSRVVDGDTVQVRVRGFDTVVRLIGIDTPETRHPSRPVECWGPEATARARALMPEGASVRLRGDPGQDTRDRYGRLLAYVYTGDRDGAASVNRALVASGAARVYVYGGVPFRHVAAFRRAEAVARAAGRGLWGPPCRGATRAPAPAPAPAPSGAPAGCDPNYTGACVPPFPPDVDCADIGRPVTVVGADPHNFDADGNGRGCERF